MQENTDTTQENTANERPVTGVLSRKPTSREFGNTPQSKGEFWSKKNRAIIGVSTLLIVTLGAYYGTSLWKNKFNPAGVSDQSVTKSNPIEVSKVNDSATQPAAKVATEQSAEHNSPNQAPPVALAGEGSPSSQINEPTQPTPKTMEEALAQIKDYKEKLALAEHSLYEVQNELLAKDQMLNDLQNKQNDDSVQMAKLKQRLSVKAKTIPKTLEEEYQVLSILEVNSDRVLVASAQKPAEKIAVLPGALLPGGATFIGFDPRTRLLKTDRGDYPIPN